MVLCGKQKDNEVISSDNATKVSVSCCLLAYATYLLLLDMMQHDAVLPHTTHQASIPELVRYISERYPLRSIFNGILIRLGLGVLCWHVCQERLIYSYAVCKT